MAGLLLACSTGCTSPGATSVAAEPDANADLVTVDTVSPQRSTLRRTTTQPATVHPYFQAELYAKVSGYLESLNADIGKRVQAGEVLATIAVPEMVKSREKQEAMIRRLEADQKRAAAEIVVAEAGVASAKALHEQAQANVASADAQLKADEIEYERFNELVENRAVAERLRDEALRRLESARAQKLAAQAAVVSAGANLNVASAQLQAAQADLAAAGARTDVAGKELEELDALMAYATLRAPFPGVVTERHTDPGDLIRNAPTSSGPDSPPLFVVSAVDRVRVRVSIPERDAPWANVGDAAMLTFQALPGQSFEGQVSRLGGSLDQSTRTLAVEIDLENPDYRLLPGLFGEATIVLEKHDNSLILPASAVRHDEAGQSYVYMIDPSNRVQVAGVVIGLDDGHVIEIVGRLLDDGSVVPLRGDERVVAAMIGRLKQDQTVRVQSQ